MGVDDGGWVGGGAVGDDMKGAGEMDLVFTPEEKKKTMNNCVPGGNLPTAPSPINIEPLLSQQEAPLF